MDYPICNETKKCFAKIVGDNVCYCNALTETYPDGFCPFRKTKQDMVKKHVRNKKQN